MSKRQLGFNGAGAVAITATDIPLASSVCYSSEKPDYERYIMRIIPHLVLAFLVGSSGCGPAKSSLPAELKPYADKTLQLSYFVARRFLAGPEYERFILYNDELTVECGPLVLDGMHRKSVPDTLALGENRKEQLSAQQIAELKREIHLLSEELRAPSRTLPAPGTLATLSDEGVAELRFLYNSRGTMLSTSLDGLTNPRSMPAKRLRSLLLKLQAAGVSERCGHRTFFNIGAESSDLSALRH